MHDDLAPRRRLSRAVAALAVAAAAVLSSVVVAAPAQAVPAPACAQATSQASCTISTSTTVTAGALGLIAPSNLYWGFADSGYDQIQSGSSSSFSSSCSAAAGGTTTCPGATAPLFGVVDARGGTSGWALSAWLDSSSSALPSGTTLGFNGANAGAAPGTSVAGSAVTATTPTNACDKNSTCTIATAATTCATGSAGSRPFTGCPAYATNNLVGATSTAQVNLYSATASTGLGAVCFGSGTVTAIGCTNLTPTAFFNMALKGGALAGTYSPTINLTVSSGP